MTISAQVPDSQLAYSTGATTLFASEHDQRFSYCLYVPQGHSTQHEPLPLVVIQHGTARSAMAYRNEYRGFAEESQSIVLAPLFPAGIGEPGELHGFKFLDSNGVRYDSELLEIVEEVGRKFNARTDRFYLHGFSGGGQFAHRFFYLHPDRLAGLSIGAPGRITQLDDSLPWWLGTGGMRERFGIDVDIEALRRVPVQMVVGSEDVETWEINNVGGPNWMDGAEKTGSTRIERLQTLKRNFERNGIDATFVLVPGVAHSGVRVAGAVQEFFGALIAHERSASQHG